jgi:hypothetical protein
VRRTWRWRNTYGWLAKRPIEADSYTYTAEDQPLPTAQVLRAWMDGDKQRQRPLPDESGSGL